MLSFSFKEKAVKSLENEVWPFDAIPEDKPPTAMEEAKAEFSDKKKDYRDLVRILKQGIKVAQWKWPVLFHNKLRKKN